MKIIWHAVSFFKSSIRSSDYLQSLILLEKIKSIIRICSINLECAKTCDFGFRAKISSFFYVLRLISCSSLDWNTPTRYHTPTFPHMPLFFLHFASAIHAHWNHWGQGHWLFSVFSVIFIHLFDFFLQTAWLSCLRAWTLKQNYLDWNWDFAAQHVTCTLHSLVSLSVN